MVVVAVAARTLHEPLKETGLPAFFPYEAPDEIPAESQIRLLPSVLHHATMLEDVAASLTEHAELDDGGVHKQALKTHYRPVVAHLPALQMELKPHLDASDQSDMSASPMPQTLGREAWTDSAPSDASTNERAWRAGGAESAGSSDEDDRFDWAIKQLHAFRNNGRKRPLHWGTHDATAEAIPCDDNDPFPWCMCTTTLCSGAAKVLADILSLDSEQMRFSRDVARCRQLGVLLGAVPVA
jgi:hypothetical protein